MSPRPDRKSALPVSRFLPAFLLDRHRQSPSPPKDASVEIATGAVLIADLQGFTALTDRFMRQGVAGAEELGVHINEFFTNLVGLVHHSGGDLVDFIGDAGIAMWRVPPGEELAVAVRAAAWCGHRAQKSIDRKALGDGQLLRLRVGIGVGGLLIYTVGGVGGHWHYLIAGNALRRMGAARSLSEPGSVVVSANAWRWLRDGCRGEVCPGGYFSIVDIDDHLLAMRPLRTTREPACDPGLSCYLPPTVREQLDSAKPEWLAEFRRVTALFACLSEDAFDNPGELDALQAAVVTMQSTVQRYGGLQHALVRDDKGTHLFAVWGLPGCTHEDDPTRAIAAGGELRTRLRQHDLECGVGVATGDVLSGLTGGAGRFQYAMVGDTLNVAARLMTAANDEVLCDQWTRQAAEHDFEFDDLNPLALRGKPQPVSVSRALQRIQASVGPVTDSFVGRQPEREALANAFFKAIDGHGGVIVIRGEAGVGKSSLVATAMQQGREQGIEFCLGAASSLEQRTAHFPWRQIMQGILQTGSISEATDTRSYLESAIGQDQRLVSWLPVLTDLLPLNLQESEITARMSGNARADRLHDLVIKVLVAQASRGPLAVVLEDTQWMDSMSWVLAEKAVRRVASLLVILICRDTDAVNAAAGKRLLVGPQTKTLALNALDADGTDALVRNRLGVEWLSPGVSAFIQKHTDGLPLFTEELLKALRDGRHLRIRAGRCDFAHDDRALEGIVLPRNLHSLVRDRVDKLPLQDQLSLKVASVIGHPFTLELFHAVHPDEPDKSVLAAQLERFIDHDLMRIDDSGPDRHFGFRHMSIQEVVYDQIVTAARPGLHRTVAVWFATNYAEDPSSVYHLLAHHWERAKDYERAYHYWLQSGQLAVGRYANREAVGILERVQSIEDRLATPPAPELRAQCARLLGLAHQGLGSLDSGRQHLERSLELLGWPRRPTERSRSLHTLALAATHIRNWFLAPSGKTALICGRATTRAAAGVALRLGHIAYFLNDRNRFAYHSLQCVTLAEAAGARPEIAQMYAALTTTASAMSMPSLARRYESRALNVARSVNDRPTTAQVHLFLGIYHAGVGSWARCLQVVGAAMEDNLLLGDRRRSEECLVVAGYAHYHSGEFSQALTAYEQLIESGAERGDAQTTGWGLLGRARVQLALGKMDIARDALREASEFISLHGGTEQEDHPDKLSEIEYYGELAAANRATDLAAAIDAANQGLNVMLCTSPLSFSTLTGMSAITATLLDVWNEARSQRADADAGEFERKSMQACRELTKFARLFAIGQPQARLRRGQLLWIQGHRRRALRSIQRGATNARELCMPYDEAQCYQALEGMTNGTECEQTQARRQELGSTLGNGATPSSHQQH